MIELQGKYNTAKVFTDNVQNDTIAQVIDILNQPFTEGSKIRIMPDAHPGAGCVIGTTMTITDKVVPNLVGVDIGCGMLTCILQDDNIDLEKLDEFIHDNIPSGFNIREEEHIYVDQVELDKLKCKEHLNMDRIRKSIGTLGGGNHFIEVGKDEEGELHIVIHSGSRYLGKQVAEYYQDLAYKELTDNKREINNLIDMLKKEGRHNEIESQLKKIKKPNIRKSLAYLEGDNMQDYLHDLKIVQNYANWNRRAMMEDITHGLGYSRLMDFTTAHNYISDNILRKGAISAELGKIVLIPMNMKDGSILCRGKGNEDWNFSAPHGAGRLMSRGDIKELVTLEEYQESMKNVYSTSVVASTIDESPFAYKPIDEIVENMRDTVEILSFLTPIYNYKAH